MTAHSLHKPLLSELFAGVAERLGYAVSVKCERVSVEETLLADRAVPLLEESHYSRGGAQPFQRVVVAEEKPGQMAAIRVTEAPQRVVVFTKKERGVRAISSILVKKLIHRLQEQFKPIPGDCALAEIRLEIAH